MADPSHFRLVVRRSIRETSDERPNSFRNYPKRSTGVTHTLSLEVDLRGREPFVIWKVALPRTFLCYDNVRKCEESEEELEEFLQSLNSVKQLDSLIQRGRFGDEQSWIDPLFWKEREGILHVESYNRSDLNMWAFCTREDLERIREEVLCGLRQFLTETFGVAPPNQST